MTTPTNLALHLARLEPQIAELANLCSAHFHRGTELLHEVPAYGFYPHGEGYWCQTLSNVAAFLKQAHAEGWPCEELDKLLAIDRRKAELSPVFHLWSLLATAVEQPADLSSHLATAWRLGIVRNALTSGPGNLFWQHVLTTLRLRYGVECGPYRGFTEAFDALLRSAGLQSDDVEQWLRDHGPVANGMNADIWAQVLSCWLPVREWYLSGFDPAEPDEAAPPPPEPLPPIEVDGSASGPSPPAGSSPPPSGVEVAPPVVPEGAGGPPPPANGVDAKEVADLKTAQIGTPQADVVPSQPKPKKSTVRNEGQDKLLAALLKHHKYDGSSCLNQEPAQSNALGRSAEVQQSTASDFFKKFFGGYSEYQVVCRDVGKLLLSLKLLSGDIRPRQLLEHQKEAADESKG